MSQKKVIEIGEEIDPFNKDRNYEDVNKLYSKSGGSFYNSGMNSENQNSYKRTSQGFYNNNSSSPSDNYSNPIQKSSEESTPNNSSTSTPNLGGFMSRRKSTVNAPVTSITSSGDTFAPIAEENHDAGGFTSSNNLNSKRFERRNTTMIPATTELYAAEDEGSAYVPSLSKNSRVKYYFRK